MLKPAEFFQGHLDRGVKASDNTITLARGQAKALDRVGVGNYTYLNVRDSTGVEVMRYTHVQDYANRSTPDTIPVSRNITANGGRRNFPPGACVKHEWFARSIRELMGQQVSEEEDA